MAYKVRKLETTTGTNITITDSEQDKINSLTLDGRCEQETTTGKNLLENTLLTTEKTLNGVTATPNSDGSITLNGTATAHCYFNIAKIDFGTKSFNNYNKFSDDYKASTGSPQGIPSLAYDSSNKYTFINVPSGTSLKNFVVKPMVRLASITDDTYEPYTGGQPSPSPDYPQPISTIENSLKITSCNKNLAQNSKISGLFPYSDSIYPNKPDMTEGDIKWWNNIINLPRDVELISNWNYISDGTLVGDISGVRINIYYKDGTVQTVKKGVPFTIPGSKIINMIVVLGNQNATNTEWSDIQFENGNQTTPFEQHLETQITANLPDGEFIGKINETYKDTLNVVYQEDGHYHLILNKMIDKVTLDGTQKNNGYINYGNNKRFSIVPQNYINTIYYPGALIKNCMNTRFETSYNKTIGGQQQTAKTPALYCHNSAILITMTPDYNITSKNEMNDWLSTHNIEVYYALATPYTVDLGIVDEMLNTYKVTTHIFNSADTNMSVTYSVLGFNKRFEEIVYSGGAIYNCILKINDVQVPNSQIAKITISNPIIDANTEYLYVGSYIAQKLTIKFKNLDNLDIKSNNNVTLDISLDVDGTPAVVPIGKFLIDDLSENYYETCEINCLDYSIKAKPNIDYSPCFVDGKAKIDTILEYICNHFGIELDSNYPKTNGNIETGLYDNTLSGKRYISYIAELKGCNAKHGRDGKLYLIPIKQASNVIINALKSKSWKLGEKFQISKVAYDDGARLFEKGDTTNNTLFIRNDNPFIKDQTTIDNIYDIVKDTIIWNLKTENYGDISLDPWDNITYTLGKESYNTLMNTNIVYEMTIMSTNEVKLPTKQQEITTNIVGGDTNSKFIRVGRTIDLINGEIKDLSEKIVDVSNNVSGVGTVNITNGSKGILHKLDIYGTLELPIVGGQLGTSATKVGYSKVGASIVKSSMPYMKPLIIGQFTVNSFKIIIKQGDNTKEYIIDDMKNLYQIGTTHDTFEYLDGKCSITRRIGLNNDGTKYILDTPYVEQLKDLNIEVPEGDYTISSNYELHLDVEYLTKNEYTDAFAKQVELQSEINVRSDEIDILSKKKVNNDEVIASINLTPEKAQIDANKISLKGKEINLTSDNININSTNFKVDKDGNCTANSFNSNNATITGGKLTLNDNGETINASVVIKNNILGYDTMTLLGANGMVFIDNDNDYNLTIGYDKDLYKGHFISISGESSETLIESDMVQSPYFNQVSLKEYKKDFEKLDNALSIIKNTDIYKYHLKSQSNKEQKHIGLVIGDGFKYSKEILSPKQNGVDLYSMISTCFKAIQEQQEQIEELEKRIEKLERNDK